MAVVKPSTRLAPGRLWTALGCVAVAISVGPLAGCAAPHNQQDGIVTINNASTFCIGLPAASGFCGSPSWATSRNLQDLAPGDCIRVTYTAADATVDTVTGAWRLPDCHHAPPAVAP